MRMHLLGLMDLLFFLFEEMMDQFYTWKRIFNLANLHPRKCDRILPSINAVSGALIKKMLYQVFACKLKVRFDLIIVV